MGNKSVRHQPVMVERVSSLMFETECEAILDITLGGGSYLKAIGEGSPSPVALYGIDRDPAAIQRATKNLQNFSHVHLTCGNHSNLKEIAAEWQLDSVDGIIGDFGLSSDQLSDSERGFAFQSDGPLDMRYSPQDLTTAAMFINSSTPNEIAAVIRNYGEERNARAIAAEIERNKPVNTTKELTDIVEKTCPVRYREKTLARTFMALRIFINDEHDAIKSVLPVCLELLSPGGIMVFLSYDSHQDRLVKSFLKSSAQTCICPPEAPICTCDKNATVEILTSKPELPDSEEIKSNSRSRSAKLRAAKKL